MRRQAYVDWERVTKDNIPESGKEYMVACIVDETAILKFATWYNEGDVVQVECNTEADTSKMTREERLLHALFGSTKEYRVPKAGFYVLTADYGIDEKMEDGAFAGCIKMLVDFGENILFAEKPLVPEGYLSEEQEEKIDDAKIKSFKIKMMEESIEKIETAASEDVVVKETLKSMIGDRPISFEETREMVFKEGSCVVSTLEIGKTLVLANTLICKLAKMVKEEGGKDKIRESMENAIHAGTLKQYVEDLLVKYKADGHDEVERYIRMYINNLYREAGFYYYRQQFAAQKKYKDVAHLMIGAKTANSLMIRLERCYRLKGLEAPAVIQMNELRMFTEFFIEYENVSHLKVNEERFPATFGIYMDGTEYEGECWIGNRERLIKDEEDDFCEEELPDSYFVVDSPNYLFQEGLYALWNPKLGHYYRGDGEHVSAFKTVAEAVETRSEICKKDEAC